MGQITSGVGLVSGLPIAEIVDQLIAIEARPKRLVESRVAVLQSQQVAFQDINAKLLALKLSVGNLTSPTTFSGTTASSSNENVLTATSSTSATPGTYNFIVDRLVSTSAGRRSVRMGTMGRVRRALCEPTPAPRGSPSTENASISTSLDE